MEPRPALFSAIAVCLLVIASGCSGSRVSARAEERVLVRLGLESGGDHPTALAARELARLAERETGGRLLIRIYEGGDLGDESELIEQVRFGGVDVAVVGARSLESISLTAAVLGRPGAYADAAALRTALSGPEGRRLAEELESERLMLLSWYDGGPECYLLPYARVDFEVDGLRIGVERSKSITEEIAAVGAVPVPLSFLDMRRSLESDLVEGVRSPLSFVLSNRFDADYRIFPVWDSRPPVLVIGSRTSLMKMPVADRAVLLKVVSASRTFQEDALALMEQRFRRDHPDARAAPPAGAGR
jgi:TRAP-type C4-dicarboxylate transport system substrate-binding protein